MELITKIPVPKSNHPIDYHSRLVSFGSCFVENMGGKFAYYKFQNITNPFGILFQLLAIEKLFTLALSEKEFTETDVFFHNERWHCFDAHSAMSHPQQEVLLENLNNALEITRKNLKEATHCIITLGTAWVYQHKASGELVANCHKVPQKEFKKRLLTIEEIEKSLENIIDCVRKFNPNYSLIFTISPVRHLKDGFTENQVSKSHLISALYKIRNTEEFKQYLYYFPSYEIVMDELRDYRFYGPDMIHPSPTAIDYIWNRFSECCIAEEVLPVMKEVDIIQKSLAHKPFNPNSESHIRFLKNLKLQIEKLQKEFDHIHF